MFLDIHALHTLPYNNVNRDGLGSPKSCVYGNIPRIRVSSQSWKRAARLNVETTLDSPTVRTRRIAGAVAARLAEAGWGDDDARRAGRGIVHACGLAPADDDDDTSVLLWVPEPVIADLTNLATEHRDLLTTLVLPELDDKGKRIKPSKTQQEKTNQTIAAINSTIGATARTILNQRSPTIALLGRMLADSPDHTVDGATQVAHAFTVHEAAADYDYFTAVDDYALTGGAGHLATAEFATGTFYRYCTVNITQLAAQLGDLDTALSVTDAWTRGFLTVIPTGKQNSTAPNTHPDLAYLTVRDAPRSLASAFEKAIVSDNGYLQPACTELDSYTGRLTTFLSDPGHWNGHATTTADAYTHLGERHDTLNHLIQAATNALHEHHTHTDAA